MQWHMREGDFDLDKYFDFLLRQVFEKLNLEESRFKISELQGGLSSNLQ
jgi:hypothetical protein